MICQRKPVAAYSLIASARLLLVTLTALWWSMEAAPATAAPAATNETDSAVPVTEPWLEPCGTDQRDGRVLLTSTRPSRHRLLRRFRGVKAMATRMAEMAEELVTSYETLRIRDDQLNVNSFPRHPGLPDLSDQSTNAAREASDVMSVAYEHLARLSKFVTVARYGELTSQHDRHYTHFVQLFDNVEADAAGGLYSLMCSLSELFQHLLPHADVLERDVVEDIRMIEIQLPQSHAHRHIRDYILSTMLRRVAQELARDLHQLIHR